MNKNFVPKISKEELALLPLVQFSGVTIVIDTYEKLHKYIPLLKKEKILGFDTETRPTFKKGKVNKMALLQLSSINNAFLIRLNKIGFPNQIKEILSEKDILKIGVAITDDIKGLRKQNDFVPNNFIDLQKIVHNYNIENKGLKKLSGIILGKRISKSQQLSNWEGNELSEAQKLYATTDAWVCLKIFNELEKN
ncbi:MAG: 3'-5' exonuclease domain-containing protein 2 [Bacteroidales bacterium]|jgi:ribonuclease D|nr:3'-5' exonuclease domain-containing protein 2 [Bacteroidales bacterium]